MFELTVSIDIKKDGKQFFKKSQTSTGLDQEQFLEMEQDLWDVQKKWALASGLK